RTFTPEEESFGRHRVVVLSDGLWKRRFGGVPNVIGQTVRMNGESYTILGVMPSSFLFPNPRAQLWAPISFAPKDAMGTRSNHFINVIARLKPGVTLMQAKADVQLIAGQLQREFSENAGLGMDVSDYTSSVVGDVRPGLLILLGAVGVVLL